MLYQQPSNQIAQHTLQTASATQPMASATPQPVSTTQPMAAATPQPVSTTQPMASVTPQPASAIQPMVSASPQLVQSADQQVDWNSKVAEVIRDQFGLKPKQQSIMYKTLYPSAYDQIPLPHKYKVLNFTKFSGQGDVSTVEHVNRFIIQCGEAGNQDALRV
jgi:hypothetical protein